MRKYTYIYTEVLTNKAHFIYILIAPNGGNIKYRYGKYKSIKFFYLTISKIYLLHLSHTYPRKQCFQFPKF